MVTVEISYAQLPTRNLTCLIFTYFISSIIISIKCNPLNDYSDWIIPSSPLLPRPSARMAIGYSSHNDTIWLLGGYTPSPSYYAWYQLISFKNNAFIDHGRVFGFPIKGYGQYYTQINQYLYIVHEYGSRFIRFNVDTSNVEYPYNSIIIPKYVNQHSCLTSINDRYLVVLGGNDLNTTQILNLSSYSWLTNIPSMNQIRESFACIAHNGQLYAVGGWNNSVYLNSVETLNIDNLENIQSETWQYLDDTLSVGMHTNRLVLYDNDIIAICGANSAGFFRDINVIHTSTNTITVSGNLDIGIAYPAVTLVNDTIYIFGGYNGTYFNSWRYINLTRTTTTLEPTINPTTVSPTTSNPTTSIPTTAIPTTADPTTSNPTTSTPTTIHPTTVTTATANLTTFIPTAYPITTTLDSVSTRATIVTTTSLEIFDYWISKDLNESTYYYDGYTDLNESTYYYDVYCTPCPDNSAGTYGQCYECDASEQPNHSRTDCVAKAEEELFYASNEFNAIISVVTTLTGCGCLCGLIMFIKNKYFIKKDTEKQNKNTVYNHVMIEETIIGQ